MKKIFWQYIRRLLLEYLHFKFNTAIASVYSSEIPTKPPGMPTHLLTLVNLASASTHSSSHLLSLVDCLVLLTGLLCFLLLTDSFS